MDYRYYYETLQGAPAAPVRAKGRAPAMLAAGLLAGIAAATQAFGPMDAGIAVLTYAAATLLALAGAGPAARLSLDGGDRARPSFG